MNLQVVVKDKELLTTILHRLTTEMIDEKSNSGWLAILVDGGNRQRMAALVPEEHLQATTVYE
jgi:hypothetical protein